MSEPEHNIGEDDLQAYVDGQLDPQRAAAVEAYLAAHPEDAERVAAYRAQTEALHAIYDPVLEEPVPPAMLRPRRPAWIAHAARAAAALVIFVLGGAAGWWVRGLEAVPQAAIASSMAERALVAHAVYVPEVRHPVEVAADEEAHLVKWLTNRLGTEIRAPKLASAGFELVGGRLLPDAAAPAAQFMYENASGQRVTLYVRAEAEGPRDTAFRWVEQGDVTLCYWIERSVGYALVGALGKEQMWQLAHLVYQELEG